MKLFLDSSERNTGKEKFIMGLDITASTSVRASSKRASEGWH